MSSRSRLAKAREIREERIAVHWVTNMFATDVRLLGLVFICFLPACATTQITTHAVGKKPPLCRGQVEQSTALVLWGTAWRDNQKHVPLREEIAAQAITKFFSAPSCFAKVSTLKSAAGRDPMTLSDTEALQFASALSERHDKVIVLRIEELGPLLLLYAPVFWEGATEVVLRVRVLDAASSALESDLTTRWKHGGAFVVKSTKTLEQDLQSALGVVFLGSQPDAN